MALISPEYLELNRAMHAQGNYGLSGYRIADKVRECARQYEIRTILDYGCGQGLLKLALNGEYDVREFDPAITGKDATPEPAEMVVCSDVLEHIEPDCLDAVLADLRRVAGKVGFFGVATRLAAKTLPDGRNAHLIVEPASWWLPRIMAHFTLEQFRGGKSNFLCIVT